MKFKVCGITREEDYHQLVNNHVDYAGFIFYHNSQRYISPEKAASITDQNITSDIKKVGVFVNASKEFIKNTVTMVQLDIVQLHGDESPEFCETLNLPYWKALKLHSEEDLDKIEKYSGEAILIDSRRNGLYGGTGTRIPRKLASNATNLNHRIILAGGLKPEDLENLKNMGFHGVDLNSGVEQSPGIKCHEKLARLFRVMENYND